MHDQSWEMKKHHWTANRQSASLFWKDEKDKKMDVETIYKSFLFMVIWLDKGITLAVSKKQNKIKNRKTQTLSCGDFVRQVIKNWDYSLWAEWALLSKGTAEQWKNRRKKNTSIKHTCFKRSFESLVYGIGVSVTQELNPNHVPFTQYRFWLCISTKASCQDWTVSARDWFRMTNPDGCFTELNIIVFAILTVFQFKYVEVYLHLHSLRDD